METINYFKIKILLENTINNKLKIILKNKLPNYKSIGISKNNNNNIIFTNEEISIISNGNLDNFTTKIICNLLLNYDNNNNNNNNNEIIKSINDINNKILKIKDYKINETNIEETLLNLSNKLLINNNNEPKIKSNNNNNNNNNNKIFEEKINKLKDKGNKEYLRKEFLNAIETYKNALSLVITNNSNEDNNEYFKTIKSILYLNMSTTEFEYNLYLAQLYSDQVINDRSIDYISIINSKNNAIKSILSKPTWSKSYYRLGKILQRLGEYTNSLNLINASIIILLNNDESNNTIKEQYEKEIEIIKEKIKIKEKCIITINSGGSVGNITKKRDYEKEAKLIINQLGNLIETKFKDYKLTKEFIKQEGNDINLNDKLLFSSLYELPISIVDELIIATKGSHYLSIGDYSNAINCFSRCIGSFSTFSQSYFLLSEMIRQKIHIFSNSRNDNDNLVVSLLLQASLFPLKINNNNMFKNKEFDEIFSCNYGSNTARCELGIIYRFGLFGVDIDLEKAKYYFTSSIENDKYHQEKASSIQYNPGYSYEFLGHMYFKGIGVTLDLKKAQYYWNLGSNLNKQSCKLLLQNEFK